MKKVSTTLIGRAQRYTRNMERPACISPRSWHGVQDTLVALCSFLPNPFPSEVKLAKRTGYSLASIERYIRLAKQADLVTVERTRTKAVWAHNRYVLEYLVEAGLVKPSICGVITPQSEGLTTTSLRDSVSTSTCGGEDEPPTAAPPRGSAPPTDGPTIIEWYDKPRPSWAPEDWRPNKFAKKCAVCQRMVKPRQGWYGANPMNRPDAAPEYIVLHDGCPPRWLEGARPGSGIRTAGDIGQSVARAQRVRGH